MTSTPTLFNPLITASDVEDAFKSTLYNWMEVYMREYEIQHSLALDTLPRPRSWVVSEDVERDAADQLPTIVIISPGLNGDDPLHDGEGYYTAWWRVGIGAFVSAKDRPSTRRLIREYIAIIRHIVMQQQSMGDLVAGIRWRDESYDDTFNFRDQLTISAGQVIVDAQVQAVVNMYAGPRGTPDVTLAGTQWPEVEYADAAVEKLEVDVDVGN